MTDDVRTETDPFPPGFFRRQDEQDDARFYRPDRFVQHIDDGAIAAIEEFYAEVGVSGRVLDLCSSWVSHLRERPAHLTALGMNRRELEANPLADAVVVHDLNADPALPFADAAFDAVMCTVSIDYLTRPVEVLRDVRRVLVPGGVVALTWSNRMFHTKAVIGWLAATEAQRLDVVRLYVEQAGGFEIIRDEQRSSRGRDPVWAVAASTALTPQPSPDSYEEPTQMEARRHDANAVVDDHRS